MLLQDREQNLSLTKGRDLGQRHRSQVDGSPSGDTFNHNASLSDRFQISPSSHLTLKCMHKCLSQSTGHLICSSPNSRSLLRERKGHEEHSRNRSRKNMSPM